MGWHHRPARVLATCAILATLAGCQPAPSSVPGSAQGTTAAPSGSATGAASPAASGAAAIELERSTTALPAGRYTTARFTPRVTLAVEAGTWRAVNLLGDFFDIQDEPDSPDVVAVQFARPSGVYGAGTIPTSPANAAAAVELLRANDALVVIEASESRMSGLVGAQVTIENPATATGTASVMQVSAGTLGIDPGRRLWIAFFDTPDGLLAVMVGGSTAGWDAALLLAEPVLESVTIGT
jgi:hypothetical protein